MVGFGVLGLSLAKEKEDEVSSHYGNIKQYIIKNLFLLDLFNALRNGFHPLFFHFKWNPKDGKVSYPYGEIIANTTIIIAASLTLLSSFVSYITIG
jgi:hypothetical protein